MVAEKVEAGRLVFVDEMGSNTSLSSLYAWAPKGERAHCCSVPRNHGPNTTLLASMSSKGMGSCLAVVGSTTTAVFEAYDVEKVLVPSLRIGQIVVMDNLCAHKRAGQRAHRGARVRAVASATLLSGLQSHRGISIKMSSCRSGFEHGYIAQHRPYHIDPPMR
jgi:hypothetical protein